MRKDIYTNWLNKMSILNNLQAIKILNLLLFGILLGTMTKAHAQCALACTRSVQVSLSDACEMTITASMLAENLADNCVEGTVAVYLFDENGQPITDSPKVSAEHIGRTLSYRITHLDSGSTCTGLLSVTDLRAPQITNCADTISVYCIQNTLPTSEGGDIPMPIIKDCDDYTYTYEDDITRGTCMDTFSSQITRQWIISDASGNTTHCKQYITIKRISLLQQTPICPENIDLSCTNDAFGNPKPSLTGAPYFEINGAKQAIIPGEDTFCELVASFSDETFPLCGGGLKIQRTWTVYDYCMPSMPGINPFLCVQVIRFEDNTPPVISCLDTLFGQSEILNCGGSYTLPAATINDDCSEVTVEIQTPFGKIIGNGGILNDAAVGEFIATYIATDECGNTTTCETILVMTDNVRPVAISRTEQDVYLNRNGQTSVLAENFDKGSFDNCAIDRFEVKRLASDCQAATDFASSVGFDCCDVGKDIELVLRVYDAEGNRDENTLMVHVRDRFEPTIDCPEDVMIDCTADYSDLSIYGTVSMADNCGITIEEQAQYNLNSCGVGTIIRRFIAIDSEGLRDTCSQTITVENTEPITLSDITWPNDYWTGECGVSVAPEDLPAANQRPTVNDDLCDLVEINYQDSIITGGSGACLEIERTWTIINRCERTADGSSRTWTHQQKIEVADEILPVLECPTQVTVYTDENAEDCSAYISLSPIIATDCSIDILYSYKIDYDNDNVIDLSRGGAKVDGAFPIGQHRIIYYAEDPCGNLSSCERMITVLDKTLPTPQVQRQLTLNLNENGRLPLSIDMFDIGSYDNCGAGQLRYELTPNVLTCDHLGETTVRLVLIDGAGNSKYGETTVFLEDTNGACGDVLSTVAQIAGAIQTIEGLPVSEVGINLSGMEHDPIITNNDGAFTFRDVPMYSDYSIQTTKTGDYLNGVSTFDLVLLQRHILGVSLLDSPYKIIAADSNGSNSITTFDLVTLRKLILNIDDSLPVDSWCFIDADFRFTNNNNPFLDDIQKVYNINNLEQEYLNVDFVAIKIGDLNASASPNMAIATNERKDLAAIDLYTQEMTLKKGHTYHIALKGGAHSNVLGMQFTLNIPTEKATITKVVSGNLPHSTAANISDQQQSEGIITYSWQHHEGQNIADKTVLRFTLKASIDTKLSEILNLSSDFTPIEACQENKLGKLEEKAIQLKVNSLEYIPDVPNVLEMQTIPNPFESGTKIEFKMAFSDTITLTIFDSAGKIIYKNSSIYKKGNQSIILSTEDWSKGVYFYQIATSTQVITQKMVKQ